MDVSAMGETMTAEPMLADAIRDVMDRAVAGTVFGVPVRHEGVALVPVARMNAWSYGEPTVDPPPGPAAGGMRVAARPVGAYVLAGGRVSWRPAIDVNKIILGGQIMAVVALLTVRAVIRARSGCRAPAEP